MATTFKTYTDPGHGWAAVKRSLLVKLGIADKITSFSYERGQTVYLEEDCDVSTFVAAFQKATGALPVFSPVSYSERSPIRSYASYRKPVAG